MNFTRAKTYLPYILLVTILLTFFGYLYYNADQYLRLLNLSIGPLLLLLGLGVIFSCTNGFLNYLLYRGLSVPLTLNESIGLGIVNTLANQLPFAGGMIAKGVYLKQKHKLAYAHFLSATVALYVCFVAASGVVGMAVLGYWKLVYKADISNLLFMGFLGMAASIFVLWVPLDLAILPDRWQQRLLQLMQGWHILAKNQLLIAKLIGVQLVMTLIFAGRLWIAFHLLSQNVTLAQCVLFSAATILTRLISITPGGLGVREVIVIGVASVLGFDAGVSTVAVGIDRLMATIVIIALGSVYTYVLSRQMVNVQPNLAPDVDLLQK